MQHFARLLHVYKAWHTGAPPMLHCQTDANSAWPSSAYMPAGKNVNVYSPEVRGYL
jgi:hypothetical protein